MSERIAKLNSLVQQEVATILSRDVEFPRSFFVTVSRAEVSDDAENASPGHKGGSFPCLGNPVDGRRRSEHDESEKKQE